MSERENQSQRAKKFIRLVESYCDFEEVTPTAINEFISKIVVHERDVKRAGYAVQRVEVYFNYIGKFENELTEQMEPTEQECKRMREEIEEAKKEKSRAYHRAYSKEYRAKNLEKHREYERMKAREYRARKKAQAALQPAQPDLYHRDIFQPRQHGNIPRQAAESDSCRGNDMNTERSV